MSLRPNRARLHPAGLQLIEICGQGGPGDLQSSDPRLPELARRHKLAPLAHVALKRAGNASAADALHPDFIDAVAQHARNLAALREVADCFSDVPWAVLKGPILSELAHPVPGVRSYTDVDVLVRPRDLGTAVRRLQRRGWRLLDRHDALLLERMPGELHLIGSYGAQIDLHWSLVNSARARATLRLPTEPLLGRRVSRQVEQLMLPTLDDEDTLLHLCLHSALAGADRLLWLLDVDQWVRRHQPRWDVVLDRVQQAQSALATALVLRRAIRTFGTPVPAPTLVAMDRLGLWRKLDLLASRLGVVDSVEGRSLARMIARSSRGSTRTSLSELARHAWAAGRGPQAARESAWEVRPDAACWKAFMAQVEQQA